MPKIMKFITPRKALHVLIDGDLFERYLHRFEDLDITIREHVESMIYNEIEKLDEVVADDLARCRKAIMLELTKKRVDVATMREAVPAGK